MKIFGSDGFRCRFGEKYMTDKFLQNFANSLGDIYYEKDYQLPILIARDTRSSGIIVEDLITSALTNKGISVELTGIMPTPGMSKLLQLGKYSIGIMITASHNPYHDNGIKMFGQDGYKLSSNIESKIESKILSNKLSGN